MPMLPESLLDHAFHASETARCTSSLDDSSTVKNFGQWLFEFRGGSRERAHQPIKVGGRHQHIHQASRPSSAINVRAVTRRTRLSFRSFNERRMRERYVFRYCADTSRNWSSA